MAENSGNVLNTKNRWEGEYYGTIQNNVNLVKPCHFVTWVMTMSYFGEHEVTLIIFFV